MARIPEETIEQIAAANDIVEVIGGYIPLKRAGSNWRALCPFHQEKTPSFNVNPQRQSYHCFGCGEGGSVFRFVMAYENIDFPAAARKLAERAGIKIVEAEFSAEEDQRSKMRRRLLALHQQAAEWFHTNLMKTAAAKGARDYLKGRGLTGEVAKAWKIGYAPDSWDAFGDWAHSQGFTNEEIRQSGLVASREENGPDGDFYDRFRDRVMFPICNESAEVIAFSGRVLQPDAKTAKYVNSPETILFIKGNVLFGLHKSKRPLIDKGFAIVCEGQIDLISAFEAGVQNVIAPQGTAFTEKQTRILKRYVEEVLLCFDSDNAGQKAADKSLPSLLGENLTVRVVELPAGEDPDSLIRHKGVEAFAELVKNAKDFFDYQIWRAKSSPDFVTVRGKMQAARKIAGWISIITDTALRETVTNRVAIRLEISQEEMVKLLKSSKSQGTDLEAQASANVSSLDQTITNLIFASLTHKPTLDWLRQDEWKHLLANETDCDLLMKIISSNFNPEDPTSVAAFHASLSSLDEAIVTQIVNVGIVRNSRLNMSRIDFPSATAKQEGIIEYQSTPDSRGRQKPPNKLNIQKTSQDTWRSLQRRQINRRLDAIYAQMKNPGLSPENIVILQKEILDLNNLLTDIARPFSSNPDNV